MSGGVDPDQVDVILSEASLVIGNGAAGVAAHASPKALLAPLSEIAFAAAGTGSSVFTLLSDGLLHGSGCLGLCGSIAPDSDEHLAPDKIVLVVSSHERVSDLVEDGVSHCVIIVSSHDDFREAEQLTLSVADAGSLRSTVDSDGPILKPVFIHKLSGEFGDLIGVHSTILTFAATLVNCGNH